MWIVLLFIPLITAQIQPLQQNAAGPHIVNSPQALFQARATSADQLDPCQYMLANLTSVESLMQHEVIALEQCLYYFLAGETAKKMFRLNIAHPIAAVPPNYLSRQPVTINFNQFTLQHFELNEYLKDISIHGYLELSWHDDRLMWDKSVWKKDSLTIHSFHHVWVPVLGSQNPENHLKNGDAFEMRKVETNSMGNVTAKLAFSLRAFCDDTDFENYPNDIYKCCFAFEPQNDREVIQFTASGLPIFTDPKNFRDYGWGVSGTVPESFDDPADIAQLGFCLNLKRASTSVQYEFTVPLFIITALILLPPCLGSVRLQMNLKAFTLVIQFMTMIIFSNRINNHHSSTGASPKPYQYLVISMLTNFFSLGVSGIILYNLRVKRNLPPWGKLSQAANAFNGVVNIVNVKTVDEFNLDKLEEQQVEGTYQKDWTVVFNAIHTLVTIALSLLTLVIYFAYILF